MSTKHMLIFIPFSLLQMIILSFITVFDLFIFESLLVKQIVLYLSCMSNLFHLIFWSLVAEKDTLESFVGKRYFRPKCLELD